MAKQLADVGTTHTFVVGKGVVQIGALAALLGEDDTKRMFAELYAAPK